MVVQMLHALILKLGRERGSLNEIDQIVESAAQPARGRAPGQPQRIKVAARFAQGAQLGADKRGRGFGGGQHLEGAGVLIALFGADQMLWAGGSDRAGQHLVAEGAQGGNLALDEGVRGARIFSGEIGQLWQGHGVCSRRVCASISSNGAVSAPPKARRRAALL